MLKFSLLVIFRGGGALISFLIVYLIARKLGAEDSGYYFWAVNLVLLLAAIGRVGLDQTVVKLTAIALAEDRENDVSALLFRAMFIALCVSILLTAGLFLFTSLFTNSTQVKSGIRPVIIGAAPAIIMTALFMVVASSLQGQRQAFQSLFVSGITVNAVILATLLLVDGVTAVSLARVFSFASGVTLIAGLALACRGPSSLGLKSSVTWQQILRSCMPLWLVVFMTQITQWTGQLMAVAWASSTEISQLSVAFRVALLVALLLSVVNLVLAPRFAALYKTGDLKELRSLCRKSVHYTSLVTSPIFLIFLVWPDKVMAIFGPDFRGGAQLLRILAIGQFVDVATGSVGWLLSMSGHERDLRNMVIFSGILSLLLAAILIPLYGVIGAAISTTVAYSFQNIVGVILVKKRLGFFTVSLQR